MKKKLYFVVMLMTLEFTNLAQTSTIKDKAIIEFKKEHYPEAIELLQQALKDSAEDAEIYYFLA